MIGKSINHLLQFPCIDDGIKEIKNKTIVYKSYKKWAQRTKFKSMHRTIELPHTTTPQNRILTIRKRGYKSSHISLRDTQINFA